MVKARILSPESVYARLELERWLEEDLQTSKRHRNRIWKALPCPALDIDAVKDIPNCVRENFGSKFTTTTTTVLEEKHSPQGSKLVLETQDGHQIETVLIHHTKQDQEPGRTTVCVSSQVGCQMGCTFCATGTMGKIANLTAAEICEQVHHARIRNPSVQSWNVVFMGMGEPLDNYQNVKEAIFSLSDPHAFAIPLRRITLSTVGVTHAIYKLAQECPQVQLALSLHAPTTEIRQQIVPTTKAYSLEKILQALDVYQQNNTRSVMMEYILIDGVNASPSIAHQLGQLLQGRNCLLNLIPNNPTDAGDRYDYTSPSPANITEFQTIVSQYPGHDGKPIRCTVRWSSTRGQEIDAACGQLALKNRSRNTNGTNHSKEHKPQSTTIDMEDIGNKQNNNHNHNNIPGTSKVRDRTRNKKIQGVEDTSSASNSLWLIGRGVLAITTGGFFLAALIWRRGKR